MTDEILFYEPEDTHGFLSNFVLSPVKLDDTVWPSSEHYYQAQKFTDPNIQQQIQTAETPDEAFRLSRQYSDRIKEDWLDVRIKVMRFIVFEKFSQNPFFTHLLVSTGDRTIKEHSHKDAYWGDGGDGQGCNELGKIMMEVRQYFSKRESYNLVRFVESSRLGRISDVWFC